MALPPPGTYEDLAQSVNLLSQIIERIEPALKGITDELMTSRQERENLRAEIYAARQRADEMADCCLYLVEAVKSARQESARVALELERLRALIGDREPELRQAARDRETPAHGYRVRQSSIPGPDRQ